MSVEEIVKEHDHKQLPPPWDRIFSLGTRLFVWTLFFGVIYLLRPFLLTIFLTFVVAYVLAHGVDGLAHRIQSRMGRVVLVFAVMVGAITATGLFLAPKVQEQAAVLERSLPKILEDADVEIHKAKKKWPLLARLLGEAEPKAPATGEGAEAKGKEDGKAAAEENAEAPKSRSQPAVPGVDDPVEVALDDPDEVKPYVSDFVREQFLGHSSQPGEAGSVADHDGLQNLQQIVTPVLGVTSAFFLALMFAFLMVLDLPNISRGIAGLKHTRIGFIYDEVADNVHTFGRTLGRALEAQLIIAVVNTILTAIGMYFMGLEENLVFLSAIVFICSFIPVAGVFISSAPICLIALQESGFGLMIVAIILILAIHFIEAYFLNPKIFGHHMHMNPVLVLIVLTIAGKLFGVWGLVLGLPLVNYFFRHAIRYDGDGGGGDTERPGPTEEGEATEAQPG